MGDKSNGLKTSCMLTPRLKNCNSELVFCEFCAEFLDVDVRFDCFPCNQ
jgi:hypothetical protein